MTLTERGFWINLEVNPELYPLSKTDDYEIKRTADDVRGWAVRDAAGRLLGQVTDLLVDTMSMRCRYVEMNTVPELWLQGQRKRMLLLSMGSLELDRARQSVVVKALRYEELLTSRLPVSPFAGLKGYMYYSQEVFAPGLLQQLAA